MKTIERIESICKMKAIEIVQDSSGIYHLQRYVTQYDSEEEKFYTIRELPDPSGMFSELSSAVAEAKLLLK